MRHGLIVPSRTNEFVHATLSKIRSVSYLEYYSLATENTEKKQRQAEEQGLM